MEDQQADEFFFVDQQNQDIDMKDEESSMMAHQNDSNNSGNNSSSPHDGSGSSDSLANDSSNSRNNNYAESQQSDFKRNSNAPNQNDFFGNSDESENNSNRKSTMSSDSTKEQNIYHSTLRYQYLLRAMDRTIDDFFKTVHQYPGRMLDGFDAQIDQTNFNILMHYYHQMLDKLRHNIKTKYLKKIESEDTSYYLFQLDKLCQMQPVIESGKQSNESYHTRLSYQSAETNIRDRENQVLVSLFQQEMQSVENEIDAYEKENQELLERIKEKQRQMIQSHQNKD